MERYGLAALRDVALSGRTVALAAGDIIGIVLIAASGMVRHGVDPLGDLTHSVLVIGPFLGGWLIAAPLLGAYSQSTLTSTRTILWAGGVAWLVATLVGLNLRATGDFPGGVTGLFGFVMTGFGLLAILGWRLVFSMFVGRLTPSPSRPNVED